MVYRPPEVDKQTGNGDWTGVKEVGIIGFQDLSAEKKEMGWQYADVYIDVELSVKDSDYTRNLAISGDLVKDVDGNLEHTATITRVYQLMDILGCKAGLNIKGEWVEAGDTPITDIGAYLSAKYAQSEASVQHNLYAFIFNKQAKAGSVKQDGSKRDYYTNVYGRLWELSPKGLKDANSFVVFMRKGNKLKEFIESGNNHQAVQDTLGTQSTGAMNL